MEYAECRDGFFRAEDAERRRAEARAAHGVADAIAADRIIVGLRRQGSGVISSQANGIENFWTLLKRALKGTYVSVEPFHLFRYLDEETFRFNSRKASDGDRFLMLAHNVIGKRLTYAQLTGKTA